VSARHESVAGEASDTAVVPYRARFDECGTDATLRASTLLRWAQDVAWIHSERLGFGREWYADRGLAWVVRGLILTMAAPIPMGATVDVTTIVSGFRRVMARRRTEVRLGDGRLAAHADTDWVMTDTRRGLPVRVPANFPALFSTVADGFEPTRVALEAVPAGATRRAFSVRPHELDPMAHANNAVYVDWLEETMQAGGMGGIVTALPRTYRLEYLVPAPPGGSLLDSAWMTPGGTARYQLSDEAGRGLLRAELSAG
jgi:acyl-CoA thioesterase FadM